MIFVCGVSASGKSSIIQAFTAENREFKHVKGSELLQRAGYPIRGLNHARVESNQRVLLALLKAEGLSRPSTIFDGHATIETEHDIYPVPNWFFREAGVAGIICITNDANTIEERRRTKEAYLTNADLVVLQELEVASAKAHALELEVGYWSVDAHDQDGFAAAVSSISRR